MTSLNPNGKLNEDNYRYYHGIRVPSPNAWSYLEWQAVYNQNNGLVIEVNNNGIGPALINSTKVMLEGGMCENLDSMFVKLVGATQFPHLTGRVENRVLGYCWREKAFGCLKLLIRFGLKKSTIICKKRTLATRFAMNQFMAMRGFVLA